MRLIQGHMGLYTAATYELTDVDIRRDFGTLLQESFEAFKVDPNYFVDIVEHAAVLRYKKEYAEVQADVLGRLDGLTDREIDEEVSAILEERGIVAPEKPKAVQRRARKRKPSA